MSVSSDSSPFVVTIDGPSGSGKGTLSKMLAKELGFHLLDSGALYRLVALAAMQKQIDLTDQACVAATASSLDVYFDVTSEQTRILLAEQDVTNAIRREEVGMNASVVAAYPPVRSALLERQRVFATMPGLIADGRDMGTMVFPLAQVKVFLTASAEARADRRYKQLLASGQNVDMAVLVNDIRERDERDTQRSVSPLKAAGDALVIDSTLLSISDVFNQIMNLVRVRC